MRLTGSLTAVNRQFFCWKIFQTKELTAVNSTVFEITELNRRFSIGLYLMGDCAMKTSRLTMLKEFYLIYIY